MQQVSINTKDLKKRMYAEQRSLWIKRFFYNKMLVFGSLLLILLGFLVLILPFFIKSDPLVMDTVNRFKAPSSEHWFGTDSYGRDVFSRVIYGGRVSIIIGLAVTLISGFFGLVIGVCSAYYRSLDHILMRFCDGLMAFPAILLAIAIMATMGPNSFNVVIALSIVFTPYVARVVRSSAIVIKEQTYIEALKSQGASAWRILALHIAPNTISPLIIQCTFIFADTILTEAALSFLGAGIPAPEPSWGNILYDGKLAIFNAWWMTAFPGVALLLTVLGLNLFGDGLRDLLDPHTNKAKK
ncbi:ABC transporter permease [Ureibacillus manganicus]|uniref:Peptide ABC transporter permease n=1 Tax=Ureibacillus manganicus DSM 26584 TaxID=1384049 RepID=A0A0A3I014_9BACL|nr:ABC transporter permease [Ureibacillus manganicus]KGR78069.1 peptide ABC transporter permease [Ureibacillus manganicus DSM 26584]